MSLRRALVFSYLEKYGCYGVSLVSTMVISRLLGPKDIGVFAIGMGLVGMVAVLRELGISTYVIQEANLDEARMRAAFTLTTVTGVGLALIVLALSWPTGAIYGDARITAVMQVLSIGFALTPLGTISQSLMTRDLQFGRLTAIRMTFCATQAVASVGLVMAGFGPVGLAWGSVVAAAVNSILSMLSRPHSLRLGFSRQGLRRVFSVGGPATVVALVEDLLASLPELLLGRMQGLAAAGLFSRARGLSQMAHQMLARAAGPVFFSAFAALQREGRSAEPLYVKATACVTALGWAALAVLGVLAGPVVLLLYGSTWTEVVPLLRWLSAAAAIALLTSGTFHLLVAGGAAVAAMKARLASLPPFIVCLVVGGLFGAVPMAIALVVATALSSLLQARAVRTHLSIGWGAQVEPLRRSAPVGLAAGVCAAVGLAIPHGDAAGALLATALGSGAALLGAGVVVAVGRHPLRDEVVRIAGRTSPGA